VSDILKIFSH